MVKGSKHSEEAKRKMSEAKKWKHYSPETEFKKGHVPWIKGRRHSEETKKKISKTWFKKGQVSWNKGKVISEETKKKLSEALKGRKAWNKGKVVPEETKKKLSEANKGRHFSPQTEFKKGQNTGNENPAKRVEVRLKISKVKKGKPHFNQRGENHPRWKGGVTSKSEKIRKTIEYKLWREAIFARDNWTCQKCGKKGVKINAHHIYNFADYSELQKSIENGITLCKKCHVEFHEIYGRENNTKGELEGFLNKLNLAMPKEAKNSNVKKGKGVWYPPEEKTSKLISLRS